MKLYMWSDFPPVFRSFISYMVYFTVCSLIYSICFRIFVPFCHHCIFVSSSVSYKCILFNGLFSRYTHGLLSMSGGVDWDQHGLGTNCSAVAFTCQQNELNVWTVFFSLKCLNFHPVVYYLWNSHLSFVDVVFDYDLSSCLCTTF